ncbi:MAG TPA: von Willebrand factor type A domain-containing protein, partial [Puia sp.]|nr:von Willebrand factor type A domain-containing protein [Puia sp.]
SKYQFITLKLLHPPAASEKKTLLSKIRDLSPEDRITLSGGGETYSSLVQNDFLSTSKFPETEFAVNINKASYSNIRRFLNMGSVVPPDAVRIEEMLNYFNFNYTLPLADSTFTFRSYLAQCPWNAANQVLYINLCAAKIDLENVPPANLVFLIDISGSMDLPNRLPLIKSAFKLLVNNLRQMDTVSIVVYGSTVGVWLPPTAGNHKDQIMKSIEALNPGGPTPGEEGIQAAYRVAKSQFIRGGNNRVILATDGDFNVGQTTEEELEKLIVVHKQWGIYLTCLGVGMGNYKDSKLQVLAERGSGNFAYLDNEREAEKVLMEEFTQTIYAVADDSYLGVRFNPNLVKSYRLIGFDNKWSALNDTSNGLQGGEIGSGNSLVAMFEITPVTSNIDSLNALQDNFARVTVTYKIPGDSLSRNSYFNCPFRSTDFSYLPAPIRFASSVVIFGELLRNSKYVRHFGWSDLAIEAQKSLDPNDAIEKEFISLVSKARKIYRKEKRK